ncbi:MAG: TIR domain-containing protein [bacterium]|nr:TIR domain-containing protein [bacterium]
MGKDEIEPLQVFVSHSSGTREAELYLQAVLDTLNSIDGIKALVDRRDIEFGDEWKVGIARMIEAAHGAILLLSPDALDSKWVQYEAHGIDHKRTLNRRFLVLPVLLLGARARRLKERPWGNFEFHRIQGTKPTTPAELSIKIREKVQDWALDRNSILHQGSVFLEQLPTMGSRELFGRDRELKTLSSAWRTSGVRLVTFRASGGVGKSALIREWLSRIQQDEYLGADRVYGWSFYSQGTTDKNVSADPFLNHALAFFGDPRPEEGSPSAKGQRLAQLIVRHKSLVILDGLEPLQFPPGENGGRLKDKGLVSLLNGLARSNAPGLCVVTTRVTVADLRDLNRTAAPEYELDLLEPVPGRQLLASLGVRGDDEELEAASVAFGGHSLALVLLGNFLNAAFKGWIKYVDKVDQLIHDMEQGGHARRVMESYVRWFRENNRAAEIEVLNLMGLFDRPAEGEAVDFLREESIPGLTSVLGGLPHLRWKGVLKNLRDAGLLSPPNEVEPDALDAHPLVREHFGAKLATEARGPWTAGHAALYQFLEESCEAYPDDSREMERLYSAVNHACAAGKHLEAFEEIILKRVWRMDHDASDHFFATRKLGLVGADFVALSQFFDRQPGEPINWRRPSADLPFKRQLQVLTDSGVRMRSLGRLPEAMVCFSEVVRRIDASDEQDKYARDGTYAAAQHSELLLISGRLDLADNAAQKAIEYADVGDRAYFKMHARTSKADVCLQLAEREEADALFRQGKEIAAKEKADPPFMYSQSCYRYASWLLDDDREDELIAIAADIEAWGLPARGSLLSRAIDLVSLGAALLQRDLRPGSALNPETEETIEQAVLDLKESGYADYLIRGLAVRSKYYRNRGDSGDLERARADLEEATRESERGEMHLLRVDVDIERCFLHIACGEIADAASLLSSIRRRATKMRYGRREAELAELARLLG